MPLCSSHSHSPGHSRGLHNTVHEGPSLEEQVQASESFNSHSHSCSHGLGLHETLNEVPSLEEQVRDSESFNSDSHSHGHGQSHDYGLELLETLHEVPSLEEQVRASESFNSHSHSHGHSQSHGYGLGLHQTLNDLPSLEEQVRTSESFNSHSHSHGHGHSHGYGLGLHETLQQVAPLEEQVRASESFNSHSHSHGHGQSHGYGLGLHETLHQVPSLEEQVRASESFNRAVLVSAHMAHLHDAYILEIASPPIHALPSFPKPASPSSLHLHSFTPIRLCQLKEGKVHRRRLLHGTLCAKTLKMHVVANILEDEDGNAVNLWIRNAVPPHSTTAQAQRLFPQGSRVCISEPYLTRSPSGVLILLVEEREDLTFLCVPLQGTQRQEATDGSLADSASQEIKLKEAMPNKEDAGVDKMSVSPFDSCLCKAEPDNENCSDVVLEAENDGGIPGGSLVESASAEIKLKEAISDKEATEDGEDIPNESLVEIPCEESKLKEAMPNKEVTENGEAIPNGSLVESSYKEESKLKEAMPDKEVTEAENSEPIFNGPLVESCYKESKLKKSMPEKQEVEREEENKKSSYEVQAENIGKTNAESSTDDSESKFPKVSYEEEQDSQKVKVIGNPNLSSSLYEEKQDIQNVEKNEKTVAKESSGDLVNGNLSKSSYNTEHVTREVKRLTKVEDPYSGLSATALRLHGNHLFAKGDFGEAAKFYSSSIQKARSQDNEGGEVVDESGEVVNEVVMGFSNRAEVWLRLKKNDAALEDSEAALAEKANHLKSLFRKARSLMGLQRYDEALVLLKDVYERAPKHPDVNAALLQCRAGIEKKRKPGKKKRAAAQKQQQKLSS